ncbi:MAG: transcription-repair coupling factor [Burkholderiales bacterium]|jgi:transcription-repair coupling factor (superfamily II helicase)|nr:transcription-repair coupling factor [Burkholderiales bacterium]
MTFLLSRPLAKPPAVGQKIVLPVMPGSGDALALAQAAAQCLEQKSSLLVICEDSAHVHRLEEEMRWWLAPVQHPQAPPLQVPSLQVRMAVFPDGETLPYDPFSPHQDLISERIATLYRMLRGDVDIVLTAAATALQRLPPPSYLAAHTFLLKTGDRIDADALRAQLVLAGYSAVTQVVAPGEFSVRGSLIDLFPMGAPLPYRLDLFGDELESIKTFDVDNQRSLAAVNEVRMLPAREFPLDETARKRFRQAFRESFEGDPSRSLLYKDVSNGLTPGGLEYYLPLFFDHTALFTDYLPDNTVVALHGDPLKACETFWSETQQRYRLLRGDPQRPPLPPEALFASADVLFGAIKALPRLVLPTGADIADEAPLQSLPPIMIDRRAKDPFAALRQWLESTKTCATETRVLLVAESAGRRETMQQMLRAGGITLPNTDDLDAWLTDTASPRQAFAVGPLASGFVWRDADLILFTEYDLYRDSANRAVARRRRDRARRVSDVDTLIRNLAEVRTGDPVVHEQHGIGRYLGLVTLDLDDGSAEFLHLQYANDATLYVPVADLFLISRYSGVTQDAVTLNELGSGQWEKARRRAAKKAFDTAADLLNLYAQRAARQGHRFAFDEHDYARFADGFAFEETADQQAAIDAVVADLVSGKPMDRLVCGDVGFGKTEVALRAAFVALADGKQVALLVPTTLLAEQHFQIFSDRFAEWPVRIAELSRFRSAKESKITLDGLASGGVDLVIGTHKLIQPDIRFKNLGLIIIDEEHRFGVRQKEQLKKLRAEVDVLTLTATPIPRTLAMSLEGLRDFSVIATAPQKRLAIKTFVFPYSAGIVREAIARELKRGGQVYFLHNDIHTLADKAARIAEMMPEARVAVAHGQMPERELEQVMRGFYQQRTNVLVCSTIIETGIDVPSANTILIERADRFGLAQLHQLRGRVGRSHHQAYAYLLTPPEEALTAQAKKRLEAIQHMEQLGSGFYLAMHDLEIRGAGEVLGDEQSGEIAEVGFQLYADMLEHAVEALKAGREPDLNEPLRIATEVHLHQPALLPESYCPDVHERLVLYKRLANTSSFEALEALHEELIDRFGLLPAEGQALMACHRLRLLTRPYGVTRLDINAERAVFTFTEKPAFDPGHLILLVQRDQQVRFAGPHRVRIEKKTAGIEEILALVHDFLSQLKLDSAPG